VVSRLKMRGELIKLVRLLLGLSPAVIADLPSPELDVDPAEEKKKLSASPEKEAHPK